MKITDQIMRAVAEACVEGPTGERGIALRDAVRSGIEQLAAENLALLEVLEKCYETFMTGQPEIRGDVTVYPLDGPMVGNAINAIRPWRPVLKERTELTKEGPT